MAEEEIFTQRLDKIAQLKSKGINSYPTKFDITFTAEKILNYKLACCAKSATFFFQHQFAIYGECGVFLLQ